MTPRTLCAALAPVVGAAVAIAPAAVPAAAQTDSVTPTAGMLRYPDVSDSHIVFLYANDLWLVPREGGEARPLASPPGEESFPKFSPDNATIAFMGNYDGDTDLYTVSVNGGAPTRLTHHPATEVLNDWTPAGDLLFFTNALAGNPRQTQLFTTSAAGGMWDKLPLAWGAVGSVSPDGQWIAYTPHTRDTRTWKRYRGGMATDIWLFNLETYESTKITDWEGTDTQPMWSGSTVYYLSDAGPEHRLNIWSYDTRNNRRAQVTNFTEFDVKWPSMGPGPNGRGEIVFQNGVDLYLLDLGGNVMRTVDVTIPGARPTIRPQRVDASDFIQSFEISPTGQRAVVEARGDIWTLPAENGSPRNLTRTSGVAERSPAWSPDARWISYFSDETGEYELYIAQSDGKGETRQLTSGSENFFYARSWSPDSQRIAFTDKAGAIHLHTVETGETTIIGQNAWADQPTVSWSHDSRWIAYDRGGDKTNLASIWLYDTKTGESHKVTSDYFNDSDPVFDRKGDFLYFASNRSWQPSYGELDTSFIYANTQLLLAVPLREEIESPYLPESDEESWDDEKQESDEPENGEEGEDGDADEPADEPAPDDGLSGVWEGRITGGDPIPPGGMDISVTVILDASGGVSGSVWTPLGPGSITDGSFDSSSGALTFTADFGPGGVVEFKCAVQGDALSGTATVAGMGMVADVSASRTEVGVEGGEDGGDGGDDKPAEVVEIDLDGFESRAMLLPVERGNFSNLRVNDRNQLLYTRFTARGQSGAPEIKIFDIDDEKKQEKTVTKGAGAFEISADGKKIIVGMGGAHQIMDASANAAGKPVVTSNMTAMINPRKEWRQVFHEAWRLQRDFFYDPGLHGVDWPAMRDHYAKMLDDCVTRQDVAYVIRELISELNVGHAYYRAGRTAPETPSVPVGLLGCDFELAEAGGAAAFRIARIHEGGPWDADARGPLSQPGVDVKEGDFLLAVNGVPVDTDKDPWAAFIGTAGQEITITVSESPVLDESAREVVVKPMGSEASLRYRAWVEANRQYVEYRSDGRIGYIHVPDTGVNGQNELVRQFYGQKDKEGLIIDERWNGGGQIPTRFIELLNRPVTNYWARRDGQDWTWPPDAHHGPKCMLINGLAGSGGDMFPWLFRQSNLGKLIGTRTWGGLVGISGNPGMIDGSGVTVPTFGFYEKDGTWGVEGHGVDPDIEVLADPALMVDGSDPQLDRAIEHMLEQVETNPYQPPRRPPSPNRAGMGLTEADK